MGLRKGSSFFLSTFFDPHHYYIIHTYPFITKYSVYSQINFIFHTRPEDGIPSEESTKKKQEKIAPIFYSSKFKKREKKRMTHNQSPDLEY